MKILIVDDEPMNLALLSHILEEEGYTDYHEASNGQDAIDLFSQYAPDLVLLDVMMEGMDGYEVATKIKSLAGRIYLPIIFITALDDQASLAKCLEVGGDDFLTKPFERALLTAKIRAHIRTRLLSRKAYEDNKALTYYRHSVEREHRIVEHIFANVVKTHPTVEPYFDYRLAPASNFNGDVFLTEPSPTGGIYFLVGDFTGHGLASAIGALPLTKAFKAMSHKGLSVSEMASTLNDTLYLMLPDDMFFACAIVEVSQSGKQITVWNGGMPTLLLVNVSGHITYRFHSMHMALGILDEDEFEQDAERADAQYGDRLLCYSDGVIELSNDSDEMLGEELLEKWLADSPAIHVSDISEKLESYRGRAEQEDDITLVSFTCLPIHIDTHAVSQKVLPFELNMKLEGQQLNNADPVNQILETLGRIDSFAVLRSNLFTVLCELYANAVDHGILKLDSNMKNSTDGFMAFYELRQAKLDALKSGYVHFSLVYDADTRTLTVQVEDSGDGFDQSADLAGQEDDNFGRGMGLVRELSQHCKYNQLGNLVTVQFSMG